MAVRITVAPSKPQGNRQKGYDLKVRLLAPILISLQDKGYVSAAHIAAALRQTGMLTPKGKPYAESVIFGMLRRGKQLGLPVIVRSPNEAASAWIRGPRPPRIPKSSPTPA